MTADRHKRVWDEAAPRYDKQIAFLERHWLTGAREWVCSRAHGRVLEIAIGTGRNLPFYRPEGTLTGIDLSTEMLAIARKRAADLGRAADLHEGDAQRLPFEDGSFDTVLCALSLCTIPDPAEAIGEMKRVLVPGGTLLLVDHIRSSFAPLRAAQWLAEQVTVRTAGEHFTRRELPVVRAPGFEIVETGGQKAGTVERIPSRKP